MPKHIAKWNPARDVWEDTKGAASLFCGHSDVYSETFPLSGMTRSGVAYELQTWEHRTGDTGSLSSQNDEDDDALLRTPCAAETGGGPLHPDDAKANGQTLRLTGQILAHTGHLLPSPRTSDTNGPGLHGTGGMDPRTAVSLMPTPMTAYSSRSKDRWRAQRPAGNGSVRDLVGDLRIVVEEVVPEEQVGTWGNYAPAIERWERALGRLAPAPTVPDGRNGKHRLSAVFVEWMMGLPAGWVTDVPITRNEQLKALGNGVVPQQASAALTDMLAAFTTETAATAA